MVLGIENANVLKILPPIRSHGPFIVTDDRLKQGGADTMYTKTPFGTIIEYDQKGNVVWLWKSSAYFSGSDIYYRETANGSADYNMHENSFFFDEEHKMVYLSFRSISRILKIKYPEGNVLATYGEIYEPGHVEKGNSLFYGQHGIKRSQGGYLYLYNNNMRDSSCLPKITMLREPIGGKGSLEKIWEYDCTMEGINDNIRPGFSFVTGGNVIELADSSLFVSMSVPDSKMFIVDRDKQIVWSALPEKWNPEQNKWTIIPQYRASIIYGRSEMEHLIWGNEPAK